MMTPILFPSLLFALLQPSTPAVGGEGWMTDFEAAKALAKKENKDLLIDFTGSDWCGWCIRLKKEVFNTKEFKAEVHKHFVLVELDYPRKKKLPADLVKQNEELKNRFGIRGYPSIFLTDAAGRPYAKTGYQRGGPENYLKHLAELRKQRVARDEAFAAASDAQGVARAQHLAAGLDAVAKEALRQYQAEIDEVIAKGDAPLKARFEKVAGELAAEKAVAEVNTKLSKMLRGKGQAEVKELAPKAVAMLQAFVKKHPDLGGMQASRIYQQLGGLARLCEDYPTAIGAFKKLKELQPRMADRIDTLIAEMEKKAGDGDDK